jgi:hypothetical protein
LRGIVPAETFTTCDVRLQVWDDLFHAEQARIVMLLVERIDIDTDGLNLRLRLDGLSGLAHEMLAGNVGAAA